MRTTYYGTLADDIFEAADEVRESFYGRGGDDKFTLYHHVGEEDLFTHGPKADLSDRFFGGNGDDWLGSLYMEFTGDEADLADYAALSFDAGNGYDTISSVILVTIGFENTSAETLDLTEIKTSAISIEHWDYDVYLNLNRLLKNFTIEGGDTAETLRIDDSLIEESTGALNLLVDTKGGNDKVTYDSLIDLASVEILTGAGKDRVSLSTAGEVDSVDIRTGGQRDIVSFYAREDAPEVSISLGGGNDKFTFAADWDVTVSIEIDGGKGKDTVIIQGSTVSYPDGLDAIVRTGQGNDTIVLEGMHSEQVFAGGGNDDIYVLTGSFQNAADVIRTGGGSDRVFLELDGYSKVAEILDFSVADDVIVFDKAENTATLPRLTDVTFDVDVWQDALDLGEKVLFMDNDAGELYYGDNVMASFGGSVSLTEDNFLTGFWDY